MTASIDWDDLHPEALRDRWNKPQTQEPEMPDQTEPERYQGLDALIEQHNASARVLRRERALVLAVRAFTPSPGAYTYDEAADYVIALAERLGDYIQNGN